ncbi:MAG: hypothetical protein FWC71_02615 [Defluviitaleaceae bacterium]|nr:hypothetical protein [Defluviitaleaceae bacterium]
MAGKLIELAIKEKLTGEKQQNALDFIYSMQKEGFTFEGWSDGDGEGWDPTYNGNGFGCVLIHDDFMFFIGLNWDVSRSTSEADDALKAFAWAHTTICPQSPCAPPYCENNNNRWQIFGREFESTCHSPLQFIAPDAKTLENIKKLLMATKSD